jgi:hypothetical protein
MGISVDEWLAALRDVEGTNNHQDNPDAVTVKEFGALVKCGGGRAQHLLLDMVKAGRAEKCRKWITDTAGRKQFVTAYKLTKEVVHVARPERAGRRQR